MSVLGTTPHSGSRVDPWRGNANYEVVRLLGAGGMGVVYEAFDRERRQHVALKTLRTFSPDALYSFKQEFRALADIRHRNLVPLYELVATGTDRVFFSMQLVRGADFIEYVRRPVARVENTSPADFAKLRSALLQLVEGVQALHAAGKLHRDIKPPNVRVTPDGHVVILDFGLATEYARPADANLPREESVLGGTPGYMAPEQATDAEPTPACDWYAVGAVLYEALVGSLPFVGPDVQILTLKNTVEPPPPSSLVRDVPPDLDALCCALLRLAPGARPNGLEILDRLQTTTGSQAEIVARPSATTLTGREAQFRSLHEAFQATLGGQPVTVRVSGASGVGKSALVQHFLDELGRRGKAAVLRGRAYERESVPFKAVDSAIDALSRYLIHLEEQGESVELPTDIAALARVFPVLRRVPSIGEIQEGAVSDPQLFRRDAFAALRDLFRSLAKLRPLVLYVDDAHWGDADSAALLVELLREPNAPPLLLIMTCRHNEAETSAFLTQLRDHWPGRSEIRDLTVGPLAPEDGQRLALALLGSSDDLARRRARAVARESAGNPFLIEELVRSNRDAEGPENATLAVLTLERLVLQGLESLPAHARRWLEIVAVGGRPLPMFLVSEASGIAGDAIEETVGLVRSHRFVRGGLRDGREVVETSHDRFRETIVAHLSPATLREHHACLARAFEAAPEADAEAVAMHLIGAGEDQRAADYVERAAEQAAGKMAFDQATRLFRLRLDLLAPSASDARRLRQRLAKMLEWAGRSADAARVYQEAADGAPPFERAGLERAAAEELLACGQIEEGEAMFHRVLAAVGLQVPRSAPSLLFWLAVFRIRLFLWAALRRSFEERAANEVDQENRARIDAMSAASVGVAVTDPILAACLGAWSLLMALRHGDRFQIMRTATVEVSKLAAAGGTEGVSERTFVEISSRLAKTEKHPAAMILFRGVRGINLYLRGRWKEALEMLDGTHSSRRGHERTAGWQSNSNVFACWSLNFLGEHRELAGRHALLIADAEQRGDMYTSVQLRDGSLAIVALAADDPEAARRDARDAISLWPRDRYLLQHWHMMYGEGEIELYLGEGATAYARLERDTRALRKSLLLNVQHVRAQTAFLRGRCAIASIDARRTPLRRERIEEARRLSRKLEREGMGWTAPFVEILAAGAASAEGDSPAAARSLRLAVDLAEAADMAVYAAAGRYQLGRLLGGDEGRRLALQGEEAMRAQAIRKPERLAAMLVPGFWANG